MTTRQTRAAGLTLLDAIHALRDFRVMRQGTPHTVFPH